ncbi:olfactory receptor class A-like protein 1 [Protopterus annectens]|uniref:olfactory receptor class A-like protein 1 n=1 Tax=Protopterus annectens TaxID=7888 RepID=UPI001CFC1B31|nr:olfactory receptor class A-like protein 1 [Protopterus annectens]
MTITGIVGNLLVLALFLHSALYDCKLKKAEIILANLAASSLLVCFTGGVPNFLYVFGVKNFIIDAGCKFIVFIFRASRALTIMLTSFLSCFQCVIICTSSLRLTSVKHTLQKYVAPIISFFYTLSMVFSINLILMSSSYNNNSSIPKYSFVLGYCLVVYPDQITVQATGFFILARDLLFVILMASSSAYILFVLFRHARKAKEIRSYDPSSKPAAESHAAKTVITLVTLYVSLFGIDNLIWCYQLTVPKDVLPIISDVRYLFSMCYTLLFPIVVSTLNPKVRSKFQPSISEHDTKMQKVAFCSGEYS